MVTTHSREKTGPARSAVPLAVWPLPASSASNIKSGRLSGLAARVVAEYCPPGGLLIDARHGSVAAVASAARSGQRGSVDLVVLGQGERRPSGYRACYDLLRPGGVLAVVPTAVRSRSGRFGAAGGTVVLARGAGFGFLQHVVVLLAPIRDGAIAVRPSASQVAALRHAHEEGRPAHLRVHADVWVFLKTAENVSAPASSEALGVGR